MSSVTLDEDLKRKLERIAMPPINEANSRDGNSNLVLVILVKWMLKLNQLKSKKKHGKCQRKYC